MLLRLQKPNILRYACMDIYIVHVHVLYILISNDLIEEVLQVQIWVEDVDAVGADVKGVHD